MAKRSFFEVLKDLLEGLDSLHMEPVTYAEIISASGLKSDTVRKFLSIILEIQNRGYLLKLKDKPPMFMWLPNRSMEELLAMKFFQILLMKESLTLEELTEQYGLSVESAEKIMRILVDKNLARWAAQDTIALYPLEHYVKNMEEIDNEIQGKKKLIEIEKKA